MRRIIFSFLACVLVFTFSLALAQGSGSLEDKAAETLSKENALVTNEALQSAEGSAMQLDQPIKLEVSGTIIDNMCASGKKPEELAEFIKTHPKSCALKPECQAAGYALYSEGLLLNFSPDSNAKIVEFLQKPDSSLNVTVEVQGLADGLELISIKNQ